MAAGPAAVLAAYEVGFRTATALAVIAEVGAVITLAAASSSPKPES